LQKNRQLNVLIVDDQVGVRFLLETIVNDSGHKAYVARNGLEAVNMVVTVKPDLVFLDVRMPVMDGLEALGRIKSVSPSTKVVIMTAFSKEETFKKAKDKGALKCILKPFDVRQIRELMAMCEKSLEEDKNNVNSKNKPEPEKELKKSEKFYGIAWVYE